MTKNEIWDLIQKAKAAQEEARKAWERFHTCIGECTGLFYAARKANWESHEAKNRAIQAVEEEIG